MHTIILLQAIGNYAFGYDIVDGHGASNSRREAGDAHGNKHGSYSLHDIDGRARRVDYVADGHGFRAVVNTNEPGTAHSAPAAAVIASPYAAPVAPVVAHAAPVAPLAHAGVLGAGYLGGHGLGLAHGLGHGLGYGLGHGLLGHGGYAHGLIH